MAESLSRTSGSSASRLLSSEADDKRLLDLFYHYAGPAGGRGRGDDILRVEGINLGGHADARVADIIAACAGTRTASQLGESHLTREEALRLAAQSGHRLTWNEDRFGSLEVGKVADMAVLAEDPLTCDLDRLKDIRIERTFLSGRQVFGPI
jgi:predicted amidohydrolase YtcJ